MSDNALNIIPQTPYATFILMETDGVNLDDDKLRQVVENLLMVYTATIVDYYEDVDMIDDVNMADIKAKVIKSTGAICISIATELNNDIQALELLSRLREVLGNFPTIRVMPTAALLEHEEGDDDFITHLINTLSRDLSDYDDSDDYGYAITTKYILDIDNTTVRELHAFAAEKSDELEDTLFNDFDILVHGELFIVHDGIEITVFEDFGSDGAMLSDIKARVIDMCSDAAEVEIRTIQDYSKHIVDEEELLNKDTK